ncbi:4-(cytidine 5'-diphospho)-2-C-methyl-D-erythritol kinase [bacterium]|nr:MAG: 4-(cytidine 5'-diphospho)-2-C-methyl-D-erythritol kinase [bacterium]
MITVLAPAKVNLTLRIHGKRADGYHDIESLVQKVDLYDRITLEATSDSEISLKCDDPDLPEDSSNLAVRAAEFLKKSVGLKKLGTRIKLEKNIPHGAGLGGGSSDAAAVLMGLDKIWNLSLSRDQLLEIAEGLGSDVPLFLYPSPSLIRGRGEIVEPSSTMINAVYVIVYPDIPVSTQWAYSNFRLTKTSGKYTISELSKGEGGELNPESWKEFLVNDLEMCVLKHHPRVKYCKEALTQQGAKASLMSGSGSAVFGLFTDRNSAQSAAQEMEKKEGFRAIVALPIFS